MARDMNWPRDTPCMVVEAKDRLREARKFVVQNIDHISSGLAV
jgi:hypothetical protein